MRCLPRNGSERNRSRPEHRRPVAKSDGAPNLGYAARSTQRSVDRADETSCRETNGRRSRLDHGLFGLTQTMNNHKNTKPLSRLLLLVMIVAAAVPLHSQERKFLTPPAQVVAIRAGKLFD